MNDPIFNWRHEVTFVTRILTHYRVPFHELVRRQLSDHGINYRLIFGPPTSDEAAKGDLGQIHWAEPVENRKFFGERGPIWQPILHRVSSSSMVILGQENRHLVNYPLQLCRNSNRKVAMFGHGRNFQSRHPHGLAERWKRYWATKADWWFGYTDETRRHLEALGYPSDRITVLNNAVDTAQLREQASAITPDDLKRCREEFNLQGRHIAIFVGGIYPDKRLDFLVAAAVLIRNKLPDFELIIVGSGSELKNLRQACDHHDWIKFLGPRFGFEKQKIMALAEVYLMPGLVGLGILDAGVMGLPVVTTDFPWHSPEIAYLASGDNGLVVSPWQSVERYAAAVVELMRDPQRLAAMSARAREVARELSIETMAQRFVGGVLSGLGHQRDG